MKTIAALSFLLLSGIASVKANVILQVTFDTSSLAGVHGNLDFLFTPGSAGNSQSATAGIVYTGGGLNGSAAISGDVTPPAFTDISTPFTLGNSQTFNDVFQPFIFGGVNSFLLTLGGPAINSPNGTSIFESVFAFSLYDDAGTTPLLTTDPNGTLGTVTINLDGSATVASFANPSSALSITAVPEPGSLAFAAIGLALALAFWRVKLARSSC